MKKIFIVISILISTAVAIMPNLAFAANLPSMFSNSPEDLSVKYLGQVFGSVGSILSGGGSQMMGEIFRIVNVGMLVIAIGFTAYTIIIGLINTATDGEIMGKKINSFWAVLRIILGIGALVPTASGYSTIQIIVMWVVVQSVGLANYTWSHALHYLSEEGGVVFSNANNTALDKDGAAKSLAMATDILISQTCNAMINEKNEQNRNVAQTEARKDPNNQMLRDMANSSNNNASIRYEYSLTSQTASFGTKDSPTICGKYNLNPSNLAEKTGSINENDTAFKQVVLTLQSAARKIASFKDDPNDPAGNKTRLENLQKNVAMSLTNATIDYESIMSGAKRRSIEAADNKWKEDVKTANEEGWISAGSYYRKLGNANNKLQAQATGYQVTTISKPNAGEISNLLETSQYKSNNSLIAQAAKDAGPELISAIEIKANNGKDPINKGTAAGLIAGSSAGLIAGTLAASFLAPALIPAAASVTLLTVSLIPTASIWIDQVNRPGDPIMKLQAVGTAMTATGMALWLGLTATITGLSMVGSIFHAFTGIGLAIGHSLQPLMPVFTAVISTLFITGLTLAIYVPMIPFIIFTFAAIGWIIFVLEAMTAAPLVALGVTHPEGHDLLGKSEQALMLLLSVFLRPVMMIVGLFAAIIISQVALNILNAGLDRMITSIDYIGSGVGLFGLLAMMIIYTMVVISIINMSSNLIILVDQKIKAWIGLHPDSSTFDSQLHEIKGGLTSGMQTGSSAISKAAEAQQPMSRDKQGELAKAQNEHEALGGLPNRRPSIEGQADAPGGGGKGPE